MSRRNKPSWLKENIAVIEKFCDDNGYIYDALDPYHYRVGGAVAIVDIYPSRMVYNIISIDGVQQQARYQKNMKQQIDINELKSLLEKGYVR